MKRIILLVISILMLCGCEINNKKCVKSHIELKIMFVPNVNGGLKQIVTPFSVCDEWVVEE